MSAWSSLSPQFPWHRLTKRSSIERKNSSCDIFSESLGSWKVNNFLVSLSFLSKWPTELSKSSLRSVSCHSVFYHLNWSSKVGLYLRNRSTCCCYKIQCCCYKIGHGHWYSFLHILLHYFEKLLFSCLQITCEILGINFPSFL